MKVSRKFLALLMALVMVLTLSATAFAAEGQATLEVDIEGKTETYQVDISGVATVYTAVCDHFGNNAKWTQTPPDARYSPLGDPSSPLYDPSADAQILEGIVYEGIDYSSKAYVPDAKVEEYEEYVYGSDPVLDQFDTEYQEEYGGIYMWIGRGMAIMGNMKDMIYIGYDWTYKVNGQTPGIEVDDPKLDNFYQYYMNEAEIHAGDRIELNYDLVGTVFDASNARAS